MAETAAPAQGFETQKEVPLAEKVMVFFNRFAIAHENNTQLEVHLRNYQVQLSTGAIIPAHKINHWAVDTLTLTHVEWSVSLLLAFEETLTVQFHAASPLRARLLALIGVSFYRLAHLIDRMLHRFKQALVKVEAETSKKNDDEDFGYVKRKGKAKNPTLMVLTAPEKVQKQAKAASSMLSGFAVTKLFSNFLFEVQALKGNNKTTRPIKGERQLYKFYTETTERGNRALRNNTESQVESMLAAPVTSDKLTKYFEDKGYNRDIKNDPIEYCFQGLSALCLSAGKRSFEAVNQYYGGHLKFKLSKSEAAQHMTNDDTPEARKSDRYRNLYADTFAIALESLVRELFYRSIMIDRDIGFFVTLVGNILVSSHHIFVDVTVLEEAPIADFELRKAEWFKIVANQQYAEEVGLSCYWDYIKDYVDGDDEVSQWIDKRGSKVPEVLKDLKLPNDIEYKTPDDVLLAWEARLSPNGAV